jgi:hypothetical protein
MHQRPDDEAHDMTEEFIAQYARKAMPAPKKASKSYKSKA